jgi:propionyl-CoA carboxylase alpha chain
MADALDQFRIEGISHNIPFLAAIMHSPRFREGRLCTGFIAEEFPDGFHGRPLEGARASRFVAAAIAARLMRAERASAISGTLNGPLAANDTFVVGLGLQAFSVGDARLHEGRLQLIIDGEPYEAEIAWHIGEPAMRIVEGGVAHTIQFFRERGGYRLSQGGTTVFVTVRRPDAADLAALMPKKAAADTSKFLLCPMPGLVVSVNVSEGQNVKTGETLAIIEAMKMENVLNAERDGTIRKINAGKGDSLAVDDVILEFA